MEDADPATLAGAMAMISGSGAGLVFAKTSSRVALYSGVGAAVGFGSAAYLLWRGPDDDSAAAIAAAESGYQTAHRVATGSSALLAASGAHTFLRHRGMLALHFGAFGIMSAVYHANKITW